MSKNKKHIFYVQGETKDKGGTRVLKHYPRSCSCSIGKDHYGEETKAKKKQ